MSKPRLHQSIASVLVNQSPLHAWYKAFGGEVQEWDDARNMGTLCHKLLLGGKDIIAIEAKDWRTNAAKEARDTALSDGKIPVLSQKLAIAHELKDKVLDALVSYGIILNGESEKYVEWTTAGGCECAGTIDHWLRPQHAILDFKFTLASASPDSCARLMVGGGADIQSAAYVQAVETLHPVLAGRVKSIFVYVEMEAPHAITLVRPGGMMRQLGASKWARACETWMRLLEEYGTERPWPAYSSDIVEVNPPVWAMSQDLEACEMLERQESNAVSGE